ncbi:serine hydrolase domain-containing protein [Streptomyces sp. NRRL WC-3742]|uniref:serine hydrolase domain-containing protein n=1 Tax=Streptomyces sp. NRRL WC-3742 TaxID=1463934 RepID=UPI0004CBBAB7|nr:serine hydrolase domain-containing protein [Streptomyces sp. NRRL WC-3742]
MTNRRIAAAILAAAALTALAAPSAQASPRGLQPELNALLDQGAGTAALAEVRDHGRVVWRGAAGSADLATNRPARADGRFRIASVTKSFVATVALQLAAEGHFNLDDPIERHLPGTVPNGGAISVRQLLNHTSGLPDYLGNPNVLFHDEAGARTYVAQRRWVAYTPQKLLDVAAAMPPYFAPGQGWHYSNTNYVILGMLIEHATGQSWQEEVRDRIVQPLDLRHTTIPTTSTDIPGPHAHGYLKFPEGPADVTRLSPTIGDAAGAIISTTADLDRFHQALFGGELLGPQQLAEMTTTVPSPGLGGEYGLGTIRYTFSCGDFWGHLGGIPGYTTAMLGSRDGTRQFSLSLNEYDKSDREKSERLYQALAEKALCGTSG